MREVPVRFLWATFEPIKVKTRLVAASEVTMALPHSGTSWLEALK